MYSVPGDTTSLVPGFPIRTSSDPRSVDSSPRHIAASHVLHRLPVPRHPPCALTHLQTQKPIRKEIAHQHTNTRPPTPKGRQPHIRALDARNHYPQIKHHTPPPKTGRQHAPQGAPWDCGPVVSKPNSVSGDSPAGSISRSPTGRDVCCAPNPRPLQPADSSRPHPSPMEECFRGAP